MVRYEFKYTFPLEQFDYILHSVKNLPAMFHEIYHERQVNNIYLDTDNFDNYYANVNGVGNREKFRIRWYGALFCAVQHPVLEVKRKFGLVGDKKSYPLLPFDTHENFSAFAIRESIRTYLSEKDGPGNEKYLFLSRAMYQKPVITNHYQRRYFMSADHRYRITLDYDIQYHKVDSVMIDPAGIHENRLVMELKFDMESYIDLNEFMLNFNVRNTRNSKYVNGINAIYLHQLGNNHVNL
jgi:SPX domain protein involved in polyphosphate accumulation